MHICPKTLGDHGCAECLRTRTYDKRVWCHRMDLESRCHAENSFLTLTIDDDHLTPNRTLVPEDLVLFRKRFRQEFGPFRYFFVGEYGDETGRPHYHAALFGVGPQYEDMVRKHWKMGHVMLAELNIQTIRYITGYVTKKMTSVNDDRLDGRHPEFRTMSKGLGRGFVTSIVNALDCAAGEFLNDDVPEALRLSGSVAPLGKYMRGKIREKAIYEKDSASKLAQLLGSESIYKAKKRVDRWEEKMRDMYQNYVNSSMGKKMTFYEYLRQLQKQKNRDIEATFKLKQKGTL